MTTKIIYTETDEAPALATYSLLPIVRAFTAPGGVSVETRDISLAGRIIAQFPERLTPEQRQADDLAELGRLAKTPEANIIKLPNISASVPQLTAAIEELKSQGYDLPDYPEEPETDAEREVRARYSRVLGSAVNPVLREGNSDRRVARPVKEYAMRNPHSMGEWSADSRTHVAHMTDGDFYSSEQSAVIEAAGNVVIELETTSGEVRVLKPETPVLEGEVIDAAT
ncbi:MAG: NADP-dependent isocitrate dehydrogenase, partial [Gammaproteobacteria bacterium]